MESFAVVMKNLSHFLSKRVFLFFFLFFSSSSLVFAEETKKTAWNISQAFESSFEDLKAEELISALQSFDISAKIKLFDVCFKQYELLQGKYFTVYLAPLFFENDHIWILANPNLSTPFEDLNPAQLQELEEFRYWVGEAYQQRGYQGYVMFMDLKKDYGLGRISLCLEMIPATLKGPQGDELDVKEKIERSAYVFFGDEKIKQLTPEDAMIPKKQFENIFVSLRERDRTLKTQATILKNTLPWERRVTHIKDLEEVCLDNIKKELITRNGLLIDSYKLSSLQKEKKGEDTSGDGGEFTNSKAKLTSIKECVFCNPRIIDSQRVYEYGDFVCLYNFRPYTFGYHLMVTPRPLVHLENWQNLSLADVLHVDKFLQASVKAIKQESGREDIILFLQNGLAAGMTVPHGHIHILLRPTKLHLFTQVLLEITGHKRKGLTAEEMAPTKEKFRQRLKNLLAS